MSDNYPNLRAYLKREYDAGKLGEVAARARIPFYLLRDIVRGADMTGATATALTLVTEPMDDQWQIDDDECDPMAVVQLTDDQIRERLQHASDCGKLGVIAKVTGVKGGVETLRGILAVGEGSIDPVTRMTLLISME